MTPWKWLLIDGWKCHAVPTHLASALIADLEARPESEGKPLTWEATDTTLVTIDMPGMCYMDRPWINLPIDGLTVAMPCEDVLDFLFRVEKLPLRKWAGGGDYYKLHGFNRCIVLTPEHRVELWGVLQTKLQEAEAQATAFLADKKLPSQVLQEANAKAHGLAVDAYKDVDFGGHHLDRFHAKLKNKGEA